jgi:hypothetical protein
MIGQALMYQSNFESSSHLLSFFKFGILDAPTATIYFLTRSAVDSMLALTYLASVSSAYFFRNISDFRTEK